MRLSQLAALSAVMLTASLLQAQTPGSALSVSASGQQTSFSLDALKAMHHEQLTVTNGHTHARETYTGVPLIDLLEKVGAPQPSALKGPALSEYVVATGSDNYRAVLSLAEAEPGFHPGAVLVADSHDGKPLDTKEGPLKLVVQEDTRPARWVRNLTRIELKPAQ